MAQPSPLAAFDLSGLNRRESACPVGRDADADALKAQQEADAGKRSFLRMIGHELRTPLNSIIGFSEIISRQMYGPLNEPRYREHADIIRHSGLRMLKLVNQVMEIVRLESGAAEFDIQPLAPLQVVEAAIESLAEEAAARNVTVTALMTAPVAAVAADERALQTVLANLIANAITHSPAGGTVEVRLRMAGPRAVVLEVQDRGRGVPPDQLARLLRPFEQGEDALTRHGEGAGLGLAICRLLCEAQGGKLRLHSCRTPSEAPGFTALVRLPAA